MEKIKKQRKDFFASMRVEALRKFLSDKREKIISRESEAHEEVTEYDFEFNEQMTERLEEMRNAIFFSGQAAPSLTSLENMLDFIRKNFEAFEVNQIVLVEKQVWKVCLPPEDCKLMGSPIFCANLLEIVTLLSFVSKRVLEGFVQNGLGAFLQRALRHKQNPEIFEGVLLIMTALLQIEGFNLVPLFMELAGESHLFIFTLQSIMQPCFEICELACQFLEGLVQIIPDKPSRKRVLAFIFYFAELDLTDNITQRLLKLILYCWRKDNCLIRDLGSHWLLAEKLIAATEHSRDEALLTSAFSILGNFVGWQEEVEDSAPEAKDVGFYKRLCQSSFQFLETNHHKLPSQEKCLFLLYNIFDACRGLNTRENFARVLELFYSKAPEYELRESSKCAEELLNLLKLTMQRAKIEQQIELVSQNLPVLKTLFSHLKNFRQPEILLYALHNIVTFLNVDKIIELKLGQSLVREFIYENNLLENAEYCFKNGDSRVRGLAQFLLGEYFKENFTESE